MPLSHSFPSLRTESRIFRHCEPACHRHGGTKWSVAIWLILFVIANGMKQSGKFICTYFTPIVFRIIQIASSPPEVDPRNDGFTSGVGVAMAGDYGLRILVYVIQHQYQRTHTCEENRNYRQICLEVKTLHRLYVNDIIG
jgi:hypothetical protein